MSPPTVLRVTFDLPECKELRKQPFSFEKKIQKSNSKKQKIDKYTKNNKKKNTKKIKERKKRKEAFKGVPSPETDQKNVFLKEMSQEIVQELNFFQKKPRKSKT